MARSFGSTVNKIIRETAKAQRAAERSRNAAIREQERHLRLQRQYERENERAIKESIREQKAYEKEQKALYIEGRKEETNDYNEEILYRLNEFKSIISETLVVDDKISFESLYKKDDFPEYVQPYVKPVPANPIPLRESYFARVAMEPSFVEKISGLGKKARLRAIEATENTYNYALRDYESAEMRRNELIKENDTFLSSARAEYDEAKRLFLDEITSHNSSIDNFKTNYINKDKEAIEAYNTLVLERSNYSDIFPQTFDLFYLEESKELLVEYELPDVTAVPQNKEYKYTQSRDEIKGVPFKPKELNEIYSILVASIALH